MAIKIYIDQGHNPEGINAGAEGFGIREQDVTYQVGRFLYDILSEDDRFEARLSRPTPQTTLGYSNTSSLRERVTQANNWPADYFISIHANASENPDIMEQKLTFLPQIPQLGIWLKILSQKSCVAPVQNIMVYFPDLLSTS